MTCARVTAMVEGAMAARGWIRADRASVLGCTGSRLSRILSPHTGLTPDMALMLRDALGLSALDLLSAQRAHELTQAREPDHAGIAARRPLVDSPTVLPVRSE